MESIKRLAEYVGAVDEKFFKTTLFRSDALLLGMNCLEPGQVQTPHDHSDQDKFYYVIEGSGRFQLGQEHVTASVGELIWAPAGLLHGVENRGSTRLTLLVGIAPAP